MNELLKPKIDQLRSLVMSAADSLIQAGELAVEIIAEGTTEEALASASGLTPSMVSGLVRIGSGLMMPELLLESSLWASRLRGAPISIQRLVMAQGVELLLGNGETLKAHPRDLTTDQVKQVFEYSQIRSLGAQRVWLESQSELSVSRKFPPIPREADFNQRIAGKKMSAKDIRIARQFWAAALTN